MQWLQERDREKPFFLYLSHKAVHANFTPARRHESLYADAEIRLPESAADTPRELRRQAHVGAKSAQQLARRRFSHYHSDLDIREYLRDYRRTLAAVDDTAWAGCLSGLAIRA